MREAQDRVEAGAPVKDATRTVADWFARWRTTALAASNRKPATKSNYATLSRCHVEAEPFGAIRLDRLKPSDIDALILALQAQKYAPNTVRKVYAVLRAGLDDAVRDGLLARNPAAVVDHPNVPKKEAEHWAVDEVKAILVAAEGTRYYLALAFVAATGIRREECLGLHWDQLDLDAGTFRGGSHAGAGREGTADRRH